MSERADELRQDARFRALRLIEANPHITQRELADALGISLGATHYMLRALVGRGLIKAGRFASAKNKSAYMYLLTSRGFSEKSVLAGRFLARKRAEYEALKREIEELGAELRVGEELGD
ncbi:hypothetical protein MACH24_30890 [Erythrobacter sp. Dej080120_24]|uniref:MarR family EPS-associated transcriptional regulator n=1 Tax=Erythrobacter sp. Dej080120_24 TaxID=3024837 RepID=UPI00291E995A|nr:hypothetical protein MACH24_30890 [Erythrobacter sp. Dej080120_24]